MSLQEYQSGYIEIVSYLTYGYIETVNHSLFMVKKKYLTHLIIEYYSLLFSLEVDQSNNSISK